MVRARFTLGQIQQAAIEIVDADGLGALTMRSLAAALHTGPMTIYNYVNDRRGLEELVAEAVIATVVLPDPVEHWADEVRAVALAMWEAVRRHPNALPLVLTRRTVSPSSYPVAERLVNALGEARLAEADVLAAFRAVLAFVVGSAQAELADHSVAARIGELAGDGHPRLHALSQVSQQSTARADFERGLDFVLQGVAAARTTDWSVARECYCIGCCHRSAVDSAVPQN